jgi:peptidoglycan hydrolase-like protein with peptidoglycan-binding domain
VDKATWARLQVYATGPFVHKGQLNGKNIQRALRKAGFDPGKVDGLLGKQGREAVKDFQTANGLDADGHIGLKTLKALMSYAPQN